MSGIASSVLDEAWVHFDIAPLNGLMGQEGSVGELVLGTFDVDLQECRVILEVGCWFIDLKVDLVSFGSFRSIKGLRLPHVRLDCPIVFSEADGKGGHVGAPVNSGICLRGSHVPRIWIKGIDVAAKGLKRKPGGVEPAVASKIEDDVIWAQQRALDHGVKASITEALSEPQLGLDMIDDETEIYSSVCLFDYLRVNPGIATEHLRPLLDLVQIPRQLIDDWPVRRCSRSLAYMRC